MCYMLFSTWTCVVWSLIAWKVFNFTNLPREATFKDAVRAYKKSLSVAHDSEGDLRASLTSDGYVVEKDPASENVYRITSDSRL